MKHSETVLIVAVAACSILTYLGFKEISEVRSLLAVNAKEVRETQEEVAKISSLIDSIERSFVLDAQFLGDQSRIGDVLQEFYKHDLSDVSKNINVPRGRSSIIPGPWLPGSTVTISFMDGTENQKKKFADASNSWTDHANLRFEFVEKDGAIRVSFSGRRNNSYIGTSALSAPSDKPTLNLATVTDAATLTEVEHKAILHEIGHVFGLIHEHQNPKSPIVWNEKRVAKHFERIARRAGGFDVDLNVLKRHDASKYRYYREFDPFSIMNYDIPSEFIKEGPEILQKPDLSTSDIELIKLLYP